MIAKNSSNYTIKLDLAVWTADCAKFVTLVISTKGILLLCSAKYEKTTWGSHNTFFHNNHYTKYIDLVKSDLWTNITRHIGWLHAQHSKQWIVPLYAQVSNSFIISLTYQKWSGDVILDNSGRYCSAYKWQDKTEHQLIKTTLISSVSHLNFGLKPCLGS